MTVVIDKPHIEPGPEPIALQAISESMESATPEEILRWAVRTYGDGLTMATAFGAEGCVLMAMLAEIDPNVHIFNLDTGYQFQETLDLRDRIQERYGIYIELIQPEETVDEMEARFGGPLHNRQPDECCRLRKMVPLERVLRDKTAWISAIRREQTPDRARAAIVGPDRKWDVVKISPLANWTKVDVWRYIRKYDVPYNPLHDYGFPSIGCWPCTRAVGAGEDDRAGRWSGFAKLECGLHSQVSI